MSILSLITARPKRDKAATNAVPTAGNSGVEIGVVGVVVVVVHVDEVVSVDDVVCGGWVTVLTVSVLEYVG